jgi:hypothetical protein
LENPEPEGGFQEISMLEETYQLESQLGEAGTKLAEELTVINLSGEAAER